MKYYLDALNKYAQFSGRATRKDYWMYVLFNFLIAFAVGIVDGIAGLGGTLASIYSLAMLCPGLALCTRRLHDVNKSGWWQLLLLVPIAGIYVAVLIMFIRGTPGINSFGSAAGGSASASQPIYGNYSVPVDNKFSGYNMCPPQIPQTPQAPGIPQAPQAPQMPRVNQAPQTPRAPQSGRAVKVRCAYCGSVFEKGPQFCPNCGAYIGN